MTKKKAGKKVSSSRKRKGTNVVPFVPRERDWIDDVVSERKRRERIIRAALDDHGMTLQPDVSDIDRQIDLEIEQGHQWPTSGGLANPWFKRQDAISRKYVESVMTAIESLREAIAFCETLAGLEPNNKNHINVGTTFVHNLSSGTALIEQDNPEDAGWVVIRADGVQAGRPFYADYTSKLDALDHLLKRISDDAEWALRKGVAPRKGDGKTNVAYVEFVMRLRGIWNAKRSGERGIYRSNGTWKGEFIRFVEACEVGLPEKMRPKTAEARGRCIAGIYALSREKRTGRAR